MPRSGSWLLADALERTGGCGHPREYFRADYQPRYAAAWGLDPDPPIARYVDAVLAAAATPNGVSAVKLHWGQLVHLAGQLGTRPVDALARCFPDARYVLLTREDKVRQAISLRRAVRSERWWALAGERPPSGGAPAPDLPSGEDLDEVGRLARILAEHEAGWRAVFADRRVGRPLEVSYAQLASRYPPTVQDVLAFLDVPAPLTIPPPRLRRQADATTDAWVAAFQRRTRPAPAGPGVVV